MWNPYVDVWMDSNVISSHMHVHFLMMEILHTEGVRICKAL